jgi:hypothetical protein
VQAERNTKRNEVYFCISEAQPIFGAARVVQAERNTKRNEVYFCISEAQPIFGEARVVQAERNTKKNEVYISHFGPSPSHHLSLCHNLLR